MKKENLLSEQDLKQMKIYKYLCKELELNFNQCTLETLDYYLYMNDNNIKETIKH